MMNLAVTGFGLITSLGHDAPTSCAGIRAGISRAAPIAGAEVLDPDTQTLVPAVGHAAWGVTEGGSAIARWLALAQHAFRDLCLSARLPTDDAPFWQRTALVLITPDLDDDRFMFNPQCYREMIDESYVAPLQRALGLEIAAEQLFLLPDGRTGAIRALSGAAKMLQQSRVDRVVVLVADSCLDGHTLEWLHESDRLKAPDQPTGLMPGEAAAALLLESEESANADGRRVRVRIDAAAIDREAEAFLGTPRKHGKALVRALTEALRTGGATGFTGDLVADLNGEEWRAYDFGAAVAQVPQEVMRNHRLVLPAMSIGDVGAASGLTSLVVAATALERGYAATASALVICTSGSGRVGAALIRRA
jgi:3-oxoacyl-[acyl-carrier-protein] synthase-1